MSIVVDSRRVPSGLGRFTASPCFVMVVSAVAKTHGQIWTTAVRLTFVSLRRGERSWGVSSSRRVGNPLIGQASTLLITLKTCPHHWGTRIESMAPYETCAILGHGQRSLTMA